MTWRVLQPLLSSEAIAVLGLLMIVGGVAMWSRPAALVTGGVILIAGAIRYEQKAK